MATTTQNRPLFHRAGLIDKLTKLYMSKKPMSFKQFAQEVTTKDRYYQLADLSDLPPATLIDELTEIPEEDFATPFTKQLVPRSRKTKFLISDEAYTRDPNGIYRRLPTLLGRSVLKGMDADVAGFLSRATDSTFLTTPDGVAIASASHLNGAGTFTNILSTSAPLSYGAVELAIAELMQQESHIGDPMDFEASVDLIVPIALVPLANRIAKSMNRHDTANRELNWAGNAIRRIVAIPRATSTTAWMIKVADREFDPFLIVHGSALKISNWYDGDKDGYLWNARKMWALGVRQPRGFVYSPGA